MEKIIATIVGIILVLGLIAYAILGQVAGVKDTGDKATIEQQKISQMLQNPNIVTGNMVKNYAKQEDLDISVQNVDKDDADKFTDIDRKDIETEVKDGALYEMKKNWNADGELSEVAFKQVNLSK